MRNTHSNNKKANPKMKLHCACKLDHPTKNILTIILPLVPLTSIAANSPQDCTNIELSSARLECYDKAFGRTTPAGDALPPTPKVDTLASQSASITAPVTTSSTALSSVWELEPAEKRGTFRLMPHKLNYILPLTYTNNRNTNPSTPVTGHTLSSELPLRSTEAKYQLSVKLKAWENIIGDNGDLWLAYTQQSSWQLFNSKSSSPFRSTDYEPEAIFSWRTNAEFLGWRARFLNLGFVHQSNGQALPLSRSWNRVYVQAGLERGDYTLLIRPWVRTPDLDPIDDNPDIQSYMGNGDIRLTYLHNGYMLSALGRYSFSGKRGGIQLDWAFPITGTLKGYLQLTNGYGESLIDYNHSQTTIGLGLLLLPW